VRRRGGKRRPACFTIKWRQLLRLDYSPENCFQFIEAIEQVVVPAATRLYEKHRKRLGVESLRPWDLDQDLYPIQLPALPSYGIVADLERLASGSFAGSIHS
jgi:oligoendopeptidase F